MPNVFHVWVARGYVLLEDFDTAFALLDTATNHTGWRIEYWKSDPMWAPIRSDPRFEELLGTVGLE